MSCQTRIKHFFAGVGTLGLLLAGPSVRADSNDMDWVGVVYLWAADISADSRDVSVGIDFKDIINKLEMAFQGHVEAQGDDFGGFVDLGYIRVGDHSSNSLAEFDADLELTAMDLAFVWSPGPERLTGIEAYGGLRYIDTNFSLNVNPEPPALPTLETGINKSYTDFLAGVRYSAPINDHWRMIFSGDLSGGSTEGTWSLAAFASYRTGQHRFFAGYRHFEMEIKAGGGERLTETMSGPAIAYGYAF